MRKPLLLALGLAALALALAGLGFVPTAEVAADPGCRDSGPCQATDCEPIPTSQPVVSGPRSTGSGWVGSGSSCGTTSCYTVLRCPCGPSLASDTCDACSWPPECV